MHTPEVTQENLVNVFKDDISQYSDFKVKVTPETHEGKPALRLDLSAMYKSPIQSFRGGVIGLFTAIRDAAGASEIIHAGNRNYGGCETCDYGSEYADEYIVW